MKQIYTSVVAYFATMPLLLASLPLSTFLNEYRLRHYRSWPATVSALMTAALALVFLYAALHFNELRRGRVVRIYTVLCFAFFCVLFWNVVLPQWAVFLEQTALITPPLRLVPVIWAYYTTLFVLCFTGKPVHKLT